MEKATYRSAGVDLDLYEEAMRRLPRLMRRTHSPRVIPREGGFAGLFQLDFSSPLFRRNYQDPLLVACTDGVGTKLKVAIRAGQHNTVGIDLVAMSVNDALCYGAEPLFFLDYVAMSRDDPPLLEALVQGISEGCLQADCALLGGETAILPDMYAPGDYDLAGFCVAVVEHRQLIDGRLIAPDDIVLGLGSSGLHSNGYSLVRKIVFQIGGLELNDRIDPLDATVQQLLLEPTRIYTGAVRSLLRHYKVKRVVHGIAHITGGGLRGNLSRVLPTHVDAQIDQGSWPVPPIFSWLAHWGNVDAAEMERVFNMGIGMVLVVAPHFASTIQSLISDAGIPCWMIGRIVPGNGQVVWRE